MSTTAIVLGDLDHGAADDLVLLQLAAFGGALPLEGLFEHCAKVFLAAISSLCGFAI